MCSDSATHKHPSDTVAFKVLYMKSVISLNRGLEFISEQDVLSKL